jgi:hypothetical protein
LNNPLKMKTFLARIRWMLGRSWGVPVLAALGSWLCLFAIHGVCSLLSGVGVRMRMILGWINSAIWLVMWLT